MAYRADTLFNGRGSGLATAMICYLGFLNIQHKI